MAKVVQTKSPSAKIQLKIYIDIILTFFMSEKNNSPESDSSQQYCSIPYFIKLHRYKHYKTIYIMKSKFQLRSTHIQ